MNQLLDMLATTLYGCQRWSDLREREKSPTRIAAEIGRLKGSAETVQELLELLRSLSDKNKVSDS